MTLVEEDAILSLINEFREAELEVALHSADYTSSRSNRSNWAEWNTCDSHTWRWNCPKSELVIKLVHAAILLAPQGADIM